MTRDDLHAAREADTARRIGATITALRQPADRLERTRGEPVDSLPSGVYLAPWTIGGARVYVAVDHRGELVDWRPVAHGLRVEATIDDLWRALGRHHGPHLVIG